MYNPTNCTDFNNIYNPFIDTHWTQYIQTTKHGRILIKENIYDSHKDETRHHRMRWVFLKPHSKINQNQNIKEIVKISAIG